MCKVFLKIPNALQYDSINSVLLKLKRPVNIDSQAFFSKKYF